MTTITIKENISLSRHEFNSMKDLLSYAVENYNFSEEKVEIGLLKDSEKSQSLLKKIGDAKSSKINFNNI